MAIDILSAFQNDPPELDFVWTGFLAATVGALVAPGATGKSFWAMQAAMAVACEVPGGDLLRLMPAKTGRVVYIAGEDPEPALIKRLHSLGAHLAPDARASIAQNLVLESVIGTQLNLVAHDQRTKMIEKCAGARLIVLDTLSRVHQLDENSNSDMSMLIAGLESIAKATGAAILYLHHVNKGSTRDGSADQQQAARGASALIDNARWCGYVARMSEDEAGRLSDRLDGTPIGDRRSFFVRFGVSKQNYDQIAPDQWYSRADGGVLIPAALKQVERRKGARSND